MSEKKGFLAKSSRAVVASARRAYSCEVHMPGAIVRSAHKLMQQVLIKAFTSSVTGDEPFSGGRMNKS